MARNVKQKASNGVARSDVEVAAVSSAEQVAEKPPTRAPAHPATAAAQCTCNHRHACMPQCTPVWRPRRTDGPRLPSGASATIREWAKLLHNQSMGLFELTELKAVASVITHELLLDALDAVNAIEDAQFLSGRLRMKLLCKVVAAAVGGSVEDDDSLKLKVGKRLSAQADAVRAASDAIATRARQERSSHQHLAHMHPASRCGVELQAELATVRLREQSALEELLTEIYIGFGELQRPDAQPATAPPAAPVTTHPAPWMDAPPNIQEYMPGDSLDYDGLILYERACAEYDALNARKQLEKAYAEGRELSEKAYDEGFEAGQKSAADTLKAAQMAHAANERQKALLNPMHEALRASEVSLAKSKLREELASKHEQEREDDTNTIADLEDQVKSLQWRLAESLAREAALKGVISDNILRLRQRER